MSSLRIASVGECMLELSAAPEAGDQWRMGFAGDTFNTLWALRALLPEAECDYVSAFGDDPFSTRQIEFLQSKEIGIGDSPVIPGARPGLYAITLTGAERSFTYWRGDSAARRLADDPKKLAKSLSEQTLVYFSGITLAILEPAARATLIDAVAGAKAAGAMVAFDPNYRPRLWASPDLAKAAILEALAVSTIALPTFPDEATLFGDTDLAATAHRITAVGPQEIVVKDGESPALVLAAGVRESVPAISVSAVDTTGAGDSFNGGYLAARLMGREPAEAAAIAHRVAGAVVKVRGALAPHDVLRLAFSPQIRPS